MILKPPISFNDGHKYFEEHPFCLNHCLIKSVLNISDANMMAEKVPKVIYKFISIYEAYSESKYRLQIFPLQRCGCRFALVH
jgi:hypothetical protein